MKHLLSYVLWFAPLLSAAQGIKGEIRDEHGQPMPYATIYVTDLQKGTASNEDGSYQLRLPTGRHTLTVQFLGYHSQVRRVNIGGDWQVLDFQMEPEPTQLQTIDVTSDREDPAYTIMRKAIAKAKYHTQQIDEYRAISYIKGTGRVRDLPRLFRKKIESEMRKSGMDTATAFVSESVNELHYVRPNQFTEKVISVRKVGEDNNTSPNEFINSSFYAPKINTAISPLSPKAFAYYKFEYLGFIADRGYNINKIRVTPRSRGDQVFEGVLYIVDQLWSIHSLDLFTFVWGFRFNISQIYEPIQPTVWLPVNQVFDVSGSLFGFDLQYKYFAHIKDYDITLNPDLAFEPEVIDDKLDKQAAQSADASFKRQETEEILSTLNEGKEISRKQLRKVLREYEKQEIKALQNDTMPEVVSVYQHQVDSMAYERDSLYWAALRPIPLTRYELKGYHVMDSLAEADSLAQAQSESDSIGITIGSDGTSISSAPSKGKFRPLHLLAGGGTYRVGEDWRLGFRSFLANTHFNTVEGYHVTFRPYLFNRSGKLRWRLDPELKYSFARDVLTGGAGTSLAWGRRGSKRELSIFYGTRIGQINANRPIDPYINDLNSLLFERNYLKVYEREGGELQFDQELGRRYSLRATLSRHTKRQLANQTAYVLFGSKKRGYTSNEPFVSGLGPSSFDDYKVTRVGLSWTMRPWLKYRIVNNRLRSVDGSSPSINLHYAYRDVDLDDGHLQAHQIEAGYRHEFRVGVRGNLGLDVTAGAWIDADGLPFPEYKHFAGNRTFINITDPISSFRLLDYYRYSTASSYLEVHGHYQFRKFLLTQMPMVRLTGIRENIFLNWLETPDSDHYFEVGFGINYIFRFLRIEFVSAYRDFKYEDFGVRLGLAANLESIFN